MFAPTISRSVLSAAASCGLALMVIAPALLTRAASPVGPPRVFTSATTPRRIVALTFDDGPSPFTASILQELERAHANATFFLVGLHVARYPEYVRREARDGDTLGNHTFSHADLRWLSNDAALAQLRTTQDLIEGAAGVKPHWFRPPYGAIDTRVTELALSLNLRTILWSVDPADWARPGAQAIIFRVLCCVHPGSVIVLHDGGGDRSQTAAVVPAILSGLRARGLRPVTLDQLFGLAPPP